MDRATVLLLVGFVPVAILIVVVFDYLLALAAGQVGPNPTFDQAFTIMNWGSLAVALVTVAATVLLIPVRQECRLGAVRRGGAADGALRRQLLDGVAGSRGVTPHARDAYSVPTTVPPPRPATVTG